MKMKILVIISTILISDLVSFGVLKHYVMKKEKDNTKAFEKLKCNMRGIIARSNFRKDRYNRPGRRQW